MSKLYKEDFGLYDFILNRKNRTLDIYRYDESSSLINTKEYYGTCIKRIRFEQLLRDYIWLEWDNILID